MKRGVLILFLALFCTTNLIKAQTKRALVIGIGQYEDSAWDKINGDKDIPYVLGFLNEANYEQVITLVNEQATKGNIISAFAALTEECKPNDIVYIHFSGHGQQMKDRNKDEADAIDECWIPYDAYRVPSAKYRGEKHLVDDEVNILLTKIRHKIGDGGKMLVAIDTCFSGDSTRETADDEVFTRGVEDIFEIAKSLLRKTQSEDNLDISANIEQWISLSACQSDQVNSEMTTPMVGKLTYALSKIIKNKNVCDNNEFFKQLTKFVNSNTKSHAQKPTMTGDTERYNITDILR